MAHHLLRSQFHHHPSYNFPRPTTSTTPLPSFISVPRRFSLLHRTTSSSTLHTALSIGGGDGGRISGGGKYTGGGGNNDDEDHSSSRNSSDNNGGIIGMFLSGWRSRVYADPQLPFKLLMEQLVGLTSCVLGDMATRPNFGLNELDFVFSTLVVGAIVNVVLIYVLAPTAATITTASAPSIFSSIFANSPKGHMFESGAYTVLDRFGTLIYKGILFSAVGFAAGLLGTAISNGLLAVRKKIDPSFETPNKAPPTVLNALTWAAHMGVSCNLRYQTLTGVEFLLARGLPPLGFKASVIVLRCLNNIFGGVSFVMMARLTGSQQKAQLVADEEVSSNA
ncbi:Protein RETICULATA-RELATED 3 [Ranunculus cassubicifolius]